MGYMDNSGLYIPTGLEQTVPAAGGEYKTYGELREIEVTLNLANSTAIASPAIIDNNISFPVGMIIQEVDAYVVTAAAGSSSTLDVGFVARDRTTEVDFNGLLAAIPQATLAVGANLTYIKGTSLAGAMIGTATTTQSYLCMNWNTAAFTGGVVRLRIKYFRP